MAAFDFFVKVVSAALGLLATGALGFWVLAVIFSAGGDE